MEDEVSLPRPADRAGSQAVYARLRGQAPVHRVRLANGLTGWLVTRYAEARAALADPRLSRDPAHAAAEFRDAGRGRPLEDGAGLGAHLL
ncbi:MAG TPA: hypothetical protein VHJ17_06355, partial [Thermomonospora sp.]|nr:hypothetical protein [Thermomonospora sp.]